MCNKRLSGYLAQLQAGDELTFRVEGAVTEIPA